MLQGTGIPLENHYFTARQACIEPNWRNPRMPKTCPKQKQTVRNQLNSLEIRRKFSEQKISTKLLLQKKKTSISIENFQAGRRRFDPGRPLQKFQKLQKIRDAKVRGL
jgi:hypothetical protein